MKKILIMIALMISVMSCAQEDSFKDKIGFRGTELSYNGKYIEGILAVTNISAEPVRDDADIRIELSLASRPSIWGAAEIEEISSGYDPLYPGYTRRFRVDAELFSYIKWEEFLSSQYKFVISYRIDGGDWKSIGELVLPLPRREDWLLSSSEVSRIRRSMLMEDILAEENLRKDPQTGRYYCRYYNSITVK